MSRIETRVQTQDVRSENIAASKSAKTNSLIGNPLSQRVSRAKNRDRLNNASKKHGTQASSKTTQVLTADLQPLRDKRRDDLIAEIASIIHTIEHIEEFDGQDETTKLCKLMLMEHTRRLLLIQDTQVDSDGLKGTA